MAVQNVTIVEMLCKQIENSGEVVVLSTQATDTSATGSVLQILMTPNMEIENNNIHIDYMFFPLNLGGGGELVVLFT